MDTYQNIILLVVLILLSGFFSASETALTSFKSIHLEEVENADPKRAKLLKKWLKKPNEMLTGMLLGNNVVNILASSIATALTFNLMGDSPRAIVIVTASMTVIILIFGEITPKIIAKNHASEISKIVIVPIYILSFITKPIIKVLMVISAFIGRIFGVELKNENLMITEEDLISFVNVGEAEGIIEEEEKQMIHSIVGFGETSAKEVMTPRTKMFAVEGKKTINDIWNEIMEMGYSRIPVYDDTIDNILGILYIKDLLHYLKEGNTDVQVKTIVRQAYFVPETKSIIEILAEFKIKKVHIAMVLDEYGGIGGVLTIEDLIEEIVGEIRDEFDNEEEESIFEINSSKFEVDAMLDIETINKSLNLELPTSEDYESLGGLIVTELGRIADIGDEVNFDKIKLTVLEVNKMRVSKVMIEKESNIES
ncbi:MAG: hemolysin family protein [Cetobacterium sp.]|uniref:hemolysin family protein n=1 Tax=unclassified Cetobacterium TaxID=2630983 RepID=UPI00163BA963|nr:hemolysin family protein [Cetobacterium sp. 2A]MBC2856608.1 HlyC/CorC family transporter [Cetobacterium sp. 2A]